MNIFRNHAERNNVSIADEFGVDLSTIAKLRKQFCELGNINPLKRPKYLSSKEREAILNVFKNHSEKSNASIAGELGVSLPSIVRLRKQFRESGNIEPRKSSRKVTPEERHSILNIFKNHSERSNTSIAAKFGFSCSTIGRLREQFCKSRK